MRCFSDDTCSVGTQYFLVLRTKSCFASVLAVPESSWRTRRSRSESTSLSPYLSLSLFDSHLAQERVAVRQSHKHIGEVGSDPILVTQLGHVELVARRSCGRCVDYIGECQSCSSCQRVPSMLVGHGGVTVHTHRRRTCVTAELAQACNHTPQE